MEETTVEIPVIMFANGQRRVTEQAAWGKASRVRVESNALRLVDRKTAEQYSVLPIRQQGRVLIVAMTDPENAPAIEALAQQTGLRIRPVQARADDIRQALPLAYGAETAPEALEGIPTHLGWLLIERGLVSLDQLREARRVQEESGDRLGKVLVTLGYVNRLVIAEVLSEQLRIPYINLRQDIPTPEVVRLLDNDTARRLDAVPVRWSGSNLMVGMTDPTDKDAQAELRRILGVPLIFAVATERDIDWVLDRVYRATYVEDSVAGLLYRNPEESAYETFTDAQLISGLLIIAACLAGLILAPKQFLIGLNAVVSLFYLTVSLYRLWLAYRGANVNLTIAVTKEDLDALEEPDLPVYTILIPLYQEHEVIPQLVRAIDALDYPKSKLDVKLLLEENDRETIEAATALRPPNYFEFVIVPDSAPRTKPKACNYGLLSARGTFLVIYDAEDRPEPDQLKKVVAAFSRAPQHMACLQAKLNYYNRNQNLLTRWFTTEYSMWFDLILPGLDNTEAPIPLGGTSNHFYTEKLREVGGWDPYNVTEDADLGIRMFKQGYHTAIVDSTTYEEANSEWRNWIRQRSRWVKGYMQTWLVHMRSPVQLLLSLGLNAFTSFHLTVGGTPLVFLLNPIYWMITSLWFLQRWDVIPALFPGPVYFLAAFNLIVGNFLFIYMNLVGSYRRGYYELTRFALLSPVYWLLMSVAAWKALWQLITKPYYWEKTIHGLHTKRKWRPFIDPVHAQLPGDPPQ